ncbi:MAG: S1C family serine protease [Oceanidesulfovibrio sp.]
MKTHPVAPVLRFAPIFLAALLLCLPRPAAALDAQELFRNAQGSVVVVVGVDAYSRPKSLGTGFFIKDGRYVVTNHHVIKDSSELRVKISEGSVVTARRVKAVDEDHDIAILEMPSEGKGTPLPLSSGNPEIGEEILAIGNPRGLEKTLSTGVVSGVRTMNGGSLVYQITAPISPGSSGGPVLNANGQVLGVTSFYAVQGQNLNFAMPALYIHKLLGDPSSGDAFRPVPKRTLKMEKDESGVINIFDR